MRNTNTANSATDGRVPVSMANKPADIKPNPFLLHPAALAQLYTLNSMLPGLNYQSGTLTCVLIIHAHDSHHIHIPRLLDLLNMIHDCNQLMQPIYYICIFISNFAQESISSVIHRF